MPARQGEQAVASSADLPAGRERDQPDASTLHAPHELRRHAAAREGARHGRRGCRAAAALQSMHEGRRLTLSVTPRAQDRTAVLADPVTLACKPPDQVFQGSMVYWYNSTSYRDDLAWAASWMFKATGDQARPRPIPYPYPARSCPAAALERAGARQRGLAGP